MCVGICSDVLTGRTLVDRTGRPRDRDKMAENLDERMLGSRHVIDLKRGLRVMMMMMITANLASIIETNGRRDTLR
jgi:hypothetical protein